MKILYLSKTVVPARTANSIHVMKMCQAFAKNGHEVWLLNLNEDYKKYSIKDIFGYYHIERCFDIVVIPIMADRGSRVRLLISSLSSIPSLLKAYNQIRPDLVYGRDVFSCCVAAWVGFPVAVESHFLLWNGLLSAFAFRVLYKKKTFRRIFLITDALKQAYLANYKELGYDRIAVLPDGADPVDESTKKKESLGRSGKIQVGYIGHLYNGKGMEVIQEIAPRMPEADFHIVGGLEKDIKRWKKRIADKNVTFHGFISQKRLSAYFNAMDVCLLPIQYQVLSYGANSKKKLNNISPFTSPLKMFEYMAHGKAIVASDLPVLREVLTENVAIFVTPDDYSGWVKAIDTLSDTKMRERLGENAKQLFLKKYTWKKRAENVLANLTSDVF